MLLPRKQRLTLLSKKFFHQLHLHPLIPFSMASLRPFLSISLLSHAPKPTRLANSLFPLAPSSSSSSPPFELVACRKRLAVRGGAEAAAPISNDRTVVLDPATDEEVAGGDAAEYDWTEEWYPLYLTQDVPGDAPLGLTVFDKQLVLYRDGTAELRCHEDRCPHRLAKLSEGQLIDGKLVCLYHGWQFEGEGKCVKISQLPSDAKIPKSACLRTYEVRDSQGVVWVWMSLNKPPTLKRIPRFEIFDQPGFRDISTVHELPYDHSILLENLMDPAHVPISHDRTDFTARREDAQPLAFEVTERTNRGFAGRWGRAKEPILPIFLRFEAPCVLQNNKEIPKEKGGMDYFTGVFLCRPTGQGKSMLIVRFGSTRSPLQAKLLPTWFLHQNACKVLDQDMGFLSSQNEVLMREKLPTKELYLSLRSSDTWIVEYRRWMDKVGHGMPYYFGHSTISLPKLPAVVEHAPVGLVAGASASAPAKGGIGTMHAPNLSNRYFRHIIHCRSCSNVIKYFQSWNMALSAIAITLVALAILVTGRQWKTLVLLSAALCYGGAYACSAIVALNTTNFTRTHRRL